MFGDFFNSTSLTNFINGYTTSSLQEQKTEETTLNTSSRQTMLNTILNTPSPIPFTEPIKVKSQNGELEEVELYRKNPKIFHGRSLYYENLNTPKRHTTSPNVPREGYGNPP